MVPSEGSVAKKPQVKHQGYYWDRINAMIWSFNVLTGTYVALAHIRHLTRAGQIWLYMQRLYNRMTPMKRTSLEVQMQQLGPSKCVSIEYIDKVQMLHQQIMHARKTILRVYGYFASYEALGQTWFLLLLVEDVLQHVG